MKPAREILQEIVNHNTARAAEAGFREIDRHAETVKKKLKGWGVAGLEDVVDKAARAVKRKAAELATGRNQP